VFRFYLAFALGAVLLAILSLGLIAFWPLILVLLFLW
jgi:hypothetical protein